MNRKRKPESGCILWEGASLINGEPIVAIAIWESANEKTGDMVQVFYLYRDVDPITAVKRGLDIAVCGNCPLRQTPGNDNPVKCYVNLGRLLCIWDKYKRGGYPSYSPTMAEYYAGKPVRLGAYGDPTSAPIAIAKRLIADLGSDIWTGYTHQWRKPIAQGWEALIMASCDSHADRIAAQAKGWRTARVSAYGEPITDTEFECPAPTISCAECGLCNGMHQHQKHHVVFIVHGVFSKRSLQKPRAPKPQALTINGKEVGAC